MTRLISLSLILASLVAGAQPHLVGEKLHYAAKALGFIPIGDVWVESGTGVYNGVPTYQFNGRCYGDYLVYEADVRVKSHLDKDSDVSLFHSIQQYGSERRARRLQFIRQSNMLKYTRLESDGTFKHRRTVPIGPDVWDIFGCAFHYRREFPTNVGEHVDIKLVEITEMYHLRFTVAEKRPFYLKGIGTVEAVRVVMSALNLEPDEVFKGLLELDKDVELWIETSTRTPIFVETGVPFGIVRPTISATLVNWDAVPGFEPRILSTRDITDGS